jgi:hypothetical protein
MSEKKHKKKDEDKKKTSKDDKKKSSKRDDKKKTDKKVPAYEIRVHVTRATGLTAADSDDSSAPYVAFSLNGSKDKVYTSFKENDLNPVWDEDLVIPSPGSPAYDQLKIEVYDKAKADDLSKNDHIGLIEQFWIHSLPLTSTPTEVELKLLKTDKKGKKVKHGAAGDGGILKLTFALVLVEGGPPFPESIYEAVIEFHAAAGLPQKDVDAMVDPYIEARLAHSDNSQKFKSKEVANNLSPKWQEQARFYFANLDADCIAVVIMDKDVGEDDKMAKVSVPLKDFPIGEELVQREYQLLTPEKKGKPAGTLTLLGKVRVIETGSAVEVPEPKAEGAVIEDVCHFSWGSYSASKYSTSFSKYTDRADGSWKDGISAGSPEEDERHKDHPPVPVAKVKKGEK